jgi:hypothetical protein
MQFLNTVKFPKSGCKKLLLLAALMVLPACAAEARRNNLVCSQGGSVSTLAKANSWGWDRSGHVFLDIEGRTVLYRMMNGEMCHGATDTEFAELIEKLKQQQQGQSL